MCRTLSESRLPVLGMQTGKAALRMYYSSNILLSKWRADAMLNKASWWLFVLN